MTAFTIPTLSPDQQAALNARARRSLLRVVGADTAQVDALPDDALAGFISDLRLEVDTVGDLRRAWACSDGHHADTHAQEAWPDILGFDATFTWAEED
jgi:hypothetical protein